MKKVNGKLFSSDYQPQEKWTEEKALALGNELITWLNANDENMFFEEFLIIKKDLYSELIKYLSTKFVSFFKLIEKAKKIQEIKLYKYGTLDKLNPTMTKFVLINEHGKTSEKTENTNENTSKIVIVTNDEARKDLETFLNEND